MRGGMKTIIALVTATQLLVSVVIGGIPGVSGRSESAAQFSLDTVTGSDSSANSGGSMPNNPMKELPDKVSDSITNTDTVVSESLVVTESGEVKDIETGKTVSDPDLVGTQQQQADPLAKTDGESFVPVHANVVKEAVAAQNAEQQGFTSDDTQKDSASSEKQSDDDQRQDTGNGTVQQSDFLKVNPTGSVQSAALQNNQYGAYWGTHNGTQAFFESGGSLFAQQAKGVVDVSQWQGDIDWQAAKNAGVEGAVIRISYGWGNGFDTKALRNIQECKRLGIPFGVYSYSYSYDSNTAALEGADMVSLLRKAGVNPQDMAYPVFYDLEKWTWMGHTAPTKPNVYEGIVNAWYSKLQEAGYNNLSVYSYTSYLNGPLNVASIRNRTRWVASYGARTGFNISSNDRGWQYTSSGSVSGISGNVDLNAFGVLGLTAWDIADASINAVYSDMSGKGKYGALSAYTTEKEPGIYVRSYQRADIWYTRGVVRVVQYDLRDAFKQYGGYASLGYPTGGEENIQQSHWRQKFSNADVWTQGTTNKWFLKGDIRRAYYSHGGFSVTGMPAGNQESFGSSYMRQRFTLVDLWSSGGQILAMPKVIRDSFDRNGGFASLGGPTAEAENPEGNYWRQKCANADIWTCGNVDSWLLQGDLRRSYYLHGGWSRVGYPQGSQQRLAPTIWKQSFTHGDLWSVDSNPLVMLRELRDSYNAHGGFATLGAPSQDEENTGDGWWRQKCSLADVWTRNGDGKWILRGKLRQTYYARGGFSYVGKPIGDEKTVSGKLQQPLTKGTLFA